MAVLQVSRQRALAGAALAFNVLVNGKNVGNIKNGETKTFTVPGGPLEIKLTWAMPLGNRNSKPLVIDNLKDDAAITIACSARNRFFMNVIELSLGAPPIN